MRENLKNARKEKGLTQQHVADHLGIANKDFRTAYKNGFIRMEYTNQVLKWYKLHLKPEYNIIIPLNFCVWDLGGLWRKREIWK